MREDRHAGLGDGARFALAALGFSCWLSTMLLFSPAAAPLQRLDGFQTFIDLYVIKYQAAMHLFCCVLCVALYLLVRRGVSIPSGPLVGIGGTVHVVASAVCLWIFAGGLGGPAGTSGGSVALQNLVVLPLIVLAPLGEVLTGFVWGRVIKSFGVRQILGCVALCGIGFAVLNTLASMVPPGVAVTLSVVEAVVAAFLPLAAGTRPSFEETPDQPLESIGQPSGAGSAPASSGRFREILGISAPATVGLLAFAYVMAMMRESTLSAQSMHVGALLVTSVALAVIALPHTGRSVLSTVYRRGMPICAILVLAVSSMAGAGTIGGDVVTVATLLLYYLAAQLSIGIMGAIAHAGEFPSDALVALAVGAFSAATYAGFSLPLPLGDLSAAVVVVTTVYAAAMVAMATNGPARDDPVLNEGGALEGLSGVGDDAAQAARGDARSVEELCREIAREYKLTDREAGVLAILAQGYSCNYAAEELYITPSTARTHAHNIYCKLGVASREELIAVVRGRGLGL